jgi:hypothetical protein
LKYGDGTRFVLDESCTKLWGQPGAALSHEDLCVYLLGPVMGFLLRGRGLSPLHASAISMPGHAVALVGDAGAGKSTTAAALALRGWPVLCEDVCAFDEERSGFEVRPAYPRISLWPDSVKALFSSADALPLIVHGWEKRFLQLDGGLARFAGTPAPLATIYFLAPRSSDPSAPSVQPISAQAAVLELVQNTYMNWLLDTRQRATEFDVLCRLANTVACFRAVPSQDPARLPQLAALIESEALRTVAAASYPALGASRCNV